MSNHSTKREPLWKRSKKQAPFCPTCGTELDALDLINRSDNCQCGEWWDGDGGTHFRPNAVKKPYTVTVDGVEQHE